MDKHVRAIALSLARDAVKISLIQSGIKISHVDAKEIDKMCKELIKKELAYTKLAEIKAKLMVKV